MVSAYVSWLLEETSAWASTLLSNAAVGFFLLVPGEFVLGRIRLVGQATARAREVAVDAQQVATAALRTANDAAQSLAGIQEKLVDRQIAELNAEKDVYRAVKVEFTRDALIKALRHAHAEGITADSGVRSPVWETDLHYRYVLSENASKLTVQVEEDDGRVLSTHPWTLGETPDGFFQELVEAVRSAGRDLGTGLNLPTHSIEELMDMLVDVTELRSQELAGHRDALSGIIERVRGWYFTEKYVIPADQLQYTIEAKRLDELDWEKHLVDKRWYDAEAMIPFARRLYGSRGKKTPAWMP